MQHAAGFQADDVDHNMITVPDALQSVICVPQTLA